ncbi:condensation domain-containing protein [Plantactinospora veratri]|uniref:Condensation domain-containing protein n=1 Tax=Plantactinospora veratri TaxID=1436122 RepID=A0ABU7S8V6_9ACTN
MESLYVQVRHGVDREAPMTWGQLTQQAIYDFTADESHRQTQKRTIELPPGVPPQRIATAVRSVLERHESLRTLFSADHRQRVQPSVELSVPMAAPGADDEAQEIYTALYQRPFGPDALPVRFGVCTRADGSATLLIAASHLAIDAFAADSLADELRRLCGPGDLGVLPAPVGHPVDRTRFEGSPAGRAMSRRNIGRWQRLHEDGVASTPAPTLPGLTPRFHTGTLVSPTLRRAMPTASSRLGASPAVILLAAMSSVLGDLFGIPRVATRIAYSNRTDPLDLGIETLMQWGLAVVDVRGTAQDVARSAFRETLRASAAARYDIYELFETLSGERHPPDHRSMPQTFLNYFDGANSATMPPEDDDGPVPESTFRTVPSHEHDSDGLYFLFVSPSHEAITLHYMIDTRLLSLADLEASARALEAWVVTAARSDD